jgi:hypothetical protein
MLCVLSRWSSLFKIFYYESNISNYNIFNEQKQLENAASKKTCINIGTNL